MKIRQALISVSNKEGVLEFAQGLLAHGVTLLSTGGTARLLRDAGLPVREVGEYTGFPEMLDGRVKTLHPKVHAGILARRDLPEHMETLAQHGIPTIDLVCVNLYPFRETIAKAGVTLEEAIENIDIGGPAMVRSSAKNYPGVAVVTDPEDYPELLVEMTAERRRTEPRDSLRAGQEGFRTYRSLRCGDRQLADLARRSEPAGCLPRAPATRFRSRRDAALWRKSASAGGLLPRSDTACRFDRQLPATAGQGTLLQQHRRRRCRLGMRQDL
jgi:hypothetical protein